MCQLVKQMSMGGFGRGGAEVLGYVEFLSTVGAFSRFGATAQQVEVQKQNIFFCLDTSQGEDEDINLGPVFILRPSTCVLIYDSYSIVGML